MSGPLYRVDTYPNVQVNYEQNVREMIRGAKYDGTHPDLTHDDTIALVDQNFSGIRTIPIELFRFEEERLAISSILSALDEMNRRPLILEELIALTAPRPNVGNVISLGSKILGSSERGGEVYPVLLSTHTEAKPGQERRLTLFTHEEIPLSIMIGATENN